MINKLNTLLLATVFGAGNYAVAMEREFVEHLSPLATLFEAENHTMASENNSVTFSSFYGDYTKQVPVSSLQVESFNEFMPICASTGTISIFSGVESIPDGAFDNSYYQHNEISYVSFPSSLQQLGDRAFMATNLYNIYLPEGLQSIGEACFAFCRRVYSIEIPTTVKDIKRRAFQHVNTNIILKIAKDEKRSFEKLAKTYEDLITNAGGTVEQLFIKEGDKIYRFDKLNEYFELLD